MASERNNYVKVNFPSRFESYLAGNGEGMWVLVDDEAKRAYDSDEVGGIWSGTLDNDSVYYPGRLVHGMDVSFEMRGESRPCAVWHGFLDGISGCEGIDFAELCRRFGTEYEKLYDANDDVEGFDEAVRSGDDFIPRHPSFVGEFSKRRGDIVMSDREVAALMLAVGGMTEWE